MWANDEYFKQIVETGWHREIYGNKMQIVVRKLKELQQPLLALNKRKYQAIVRQAEDANEIWLQKHQELQRDVTNIQAIEAEQKARDKYKTTKKAAHAYMIQKTKATWIQENDENTKYFHGLLKKRYYQTRITTITLQQGVISQDQQEIKEHFIQYYKNLLGTSATTTGRLRNEVISLGPSLNLQQQVRLM